MNKEPFKNKAYEALAKVLRKVDRDDSRAAKRA